MRCTFLLIIFISQNQLRAKTWWRRQIGIWIGNFLEKRGVLPVVVIPENYPSIQPLSNLYASYSFIQNSCSFPDPYRFMAPAIILWFDMEYSGLTGEKRIRSDENIRAIYEQMCNPRQEVAVGAIATITRETKPGQQDMLEWGEWIEEAFNCNFVRAKVSISSKDGIHEPTEIEAIIPLSGDFLLFRINSSSPVKMFLKEIQGKVIFSTCYEGDEYTSYTEREFPKRYYYIKRVILAWLEEEVYRARGRLVTIS